MQLVAMRILTYVTCILVAILGHCYSRVHCVCMCDVSDREVKLASYHSAALLLAVQWSPIMHGYMIAVLC